MTKDHDPTDTDAPRDNTTRVARRQVEANDIRWLMSSKQGRRVMHRFIEHCGVYRSTFTGNSETFFKEGMRNVGLFLVAEIQRHTPDAYAQMNTEARTTE